MVKVDTLGTTSQRIREAGKGTCSETIQQNGVIFTYCENMKNGTYGSVYYRPKTGYTSVAKGDKFGSTYYTDLKGSGNIDKISKYQANPSIDHAISNAMFRSLAYRATHNPNVANK